MQPRTIDIAARRLDLTEVPAEITPLFAYWKDKRQGRLMPGRGNIDPVDLGPMLRYLTLVAVNPAPPRFIFRVVGTNLAYLPGGPRDRRDTSGIQPASLRELAERHFAEACELRRPTLYAVRLSFKDAQCGYRRLILPLAADGENPNMLLLGSVFDVSAYEEFWRRYAEDQRASGAA